MHTNRRTVDAEVLQSWEVAKQNQVNLVLGLLVILLCSISCLGIAFQSHLELGIYQDSLFFVLGIIALAIVLFSYSLLNPDSDINQQINYARLMLYTQVRMDHAKSMRKYDADELESLRTRCRLEFETMTPHQQAYVVSRIKQ